jgi:hypothetical protein
MGLVGKPPILLVERSADAIADHAANRGARERRREALAGTSPEL